MSIAQIQCALQPLLKSNSILLIAIDGRCGSGKSTLAELLAKQLDGNVFHMDDFYLPFAKRSPNWQSTPGANMDFDRLRTEVLLPTLAGKTVSYRAYHAHTNCWRPPVTMPSKSFNILEGSYSHHPALRTPFDFRIFLTCTPELQGLRLQKREGSNYHNFQSLWIPLEESYFTAHQIPEHSDLLCSYP